MRDGSPGEPESSELCVATRTVGSGAGGQVQALELDFRPTLREGVDVLKTVHLPGLGQWARGTCRTRPGQRLPTLRSLRCSTAGLNSGQ